MSIIVGDKLLANAGGELGAAYSGGSNNQIAWLMPAPSESVIIHKLGMRARRTSSQQNRPKVQLAIWRYDLNTGLPGELLGYTTQNEVGQTEQIYEWALQDSHPNDPLVPNGAGIRLMAGQQYFVGLQVEGGSLGIEVPVGAPTVTIYRRNLNSGNPSNPFTHANTTTGLRGAIYGVAELDTTPVSTTTGPAATVSTATPTLSATFTDAESGAPTLDRVRWIQLEVRNAVTTEILWTYEISLTGTRREAFSFSVVYGGPALGNGSYEWRIRAQDDVLEIGPWTAWHSFAVANLGAIDISVATPIGKDEDGAISNSGRPFDLSPRPGRERRGGPGSHGRSCGWDLQPLYPLPDGRSQRDRLRFLGMPRASIPRRLRSLPAPIPGRCGPEIRTGPFLPGPRMSASPSTSRQTSPAPSEPRGCLDRRPSSSGRRSTIT